jgi:DNA-binding CsgD family transcriptional regulator
VSPQQIVIVRLLIEQERSSKEIARELGITKKSVDKQLERLYADLKVNGRVGLINLVYYERDRIRGWG